MHRFCLCFLGAAMALTSVFAQTVDQATFDKAWAVCSKTVAQGGPMLTSDGEQTRSGLGPSVKFSRWSSPDWDEVCEPVFQEWLLREAARKATVETNSSDFKAARDAARALGAIK